MLVFARSANVGVLFFTDGVYYQIIIAVVYADNHALVYGFVGVHKHPPALLQLPQGISYCFTIILADQYTVTPLGHCPIAQGSKLIKNMTHQPSTPSESHEFSLKTNEPARRNTIL